MREAPTQELGHLPAHSVSCPACRKEFTVRFGRFGHSNYRLVGCENCPSLLALADVDPVVLYLEGTLAGRDQDLQNAITRGLLPCGCGGKFRVFDDRRRCPHCRGIIKEVQIAGQVAGLPPEMRPIPGRLYSPGHEAWTNLEFLRAEVEAAARRYEASPTLAADGRPDDLWVAKEVYDIHFRKMTPEKLLALVPRRGDLFVFNNRLFHDHGGAKGPWWRFWNREILYPERCGMVFDIDQKELRCSSCGQSFPARVE